MHIIYNLFYLLVSQLFATIPNPRRLSCGAFVSQHIVKFKSLKNIITFEYFIFVYLNCIHRSKFDPPRRSDFDPLYELTNLLEYKVHVSLPSPKALSVHVQDQCVVGNPIENSGSKGSIMEHLHPFRESQI